MQARHECRECGDEVNIKDGYKWFRESDTYECLGCFDSVNEQKHDWDWLDFGTMEEPQCGLCGCRSDNGMWDEDGGMLEDVICDDCDKVWCFDSDRDAYVPRESEKMTCVEPEPTKEYIQRLVACVPLWKQKEEESENEDEDIMQCERCGKWEADGEQFNEHPNYITGDCFCTACWDKIDDSCESEESENVKHFITSVVDEMVSKATFQKVLVLA